MSWSTSRLRMKPPSVVKPLHLCSPKAPRSRKRRRDSCFHNLNGYELGSNVRHGQAAGRVRIAQADDVEQQLLFRGPLDHVVVLQPHLAQDVRAKRGTPHGNDAAQHDHDGTPQAPPPAHHDASLPPTLGATALVPTPSGQACPTATRRPYLCVCRGVGLAELVVGRALASSEWFSVPERTPHTHLRVPLTLHTAMILVTPRRSGRPWPPSQDSGSIRLCRSAVRADGDAVFWSAVIT